MNHHRTNEYAIPKTMKAWVLGNPEELALVEKPVPEPGPAEVLVRVDAIAVCATDIEILKHGMPAMLDGELPFNRGFTPGHEYMGTIVRLGPTVDDFQIGERIAVEVHAGCGRCPRCREGMYTSCLNYGWRAKGHRANGFSTDGGFAEYAVNNINTLAHIPDEMTDAEATLIVTAGTAMYGLTELGGLVAVELRRFGGERQVGERQAEPHALARRELAGILARAGDEDRRRRLLDGARPDRHVAVLVVLAHPAERMALGPRLVDQVPGLLEARARLGRIHVVDEVFVRRTAQQAFCAEVLVNVRPVDSVTTTCCFPVVSLLRSGVQKFWIPSERHTDLAAVT